MLPGDRKFQDYAFPPAIGYPSFARENNNRPIDRQPLNPPSDMGGYPQRIPLYPIDREHFDLQRKSPVSRPGIFFCRNRFAPAHHLCATVTAHAHERARYACSFCNSFKIASPICVVLAAVMPSDLMSAVRSPLASTAAIAASILSASAPMSNE